MTDKVFGLKIVGDAASATEATTATSQGIDKVTASSKRLTDSLDAQRKRWDDINRVQAQAAKESADAAKAAEEQAKATDALDRELSALLSHLDPTYKAMRQLDTGHDLLRRSLDAGLISQKGFDDALGRLQGKYGQAAAGVEQMATAHGHATVNAGFLARELRVLFDEVISGRGSQAVGTSTMLVQRLTNIGPAGLGAAAGVAALVGGLYLGVSRFEEGARALGEIDARIVATGRDGMVTRDQLAGYINQLAKVPGISREVARQSVVELSAVPGIGAPIFKGLVDLVADFSAVSGQKAPQAMQTLARAFQNPAAGAKTLDDQFNLLTVTQLREIETAERQGRTLDAQIILYGALEARIKGLHESALTPLQKAQSELGKSWDDWMQHLANSAPIIAVTDFLATFLKNLTDANRAMANSPNVVATPGGAVTYIRRDAAGELPRPPGGLTPDRPTEEPLSPSTIARMTQEQAEAVRAFNDAKGFRGISGQLEELKNRAMEFRNAIRLDPSNADLYRQALAGINRQLAEINSQDALLKQRAQNQFEVEKAALDRGQSYLDATLKQNLISYEEYYASQKAMQNAALDAQERRLQADLRVAQAALARAQPGAQAAAARAAVEGLQGQLGAIPGQRGDIDLRTGQGLLDAQNTLASQLRGLQAQYLQTSGQTVQAAIAQFDNQFDALILRLMAEGDEAGLQFMGRLFNQQVAAAKFGELNDALKRSLDDMAEQERAVGVQQQAGILTQTEARKKIIALHRDEAAAIQAVLPQLEAEAAGNQKLIDITEQLKKKVGELRSVQDNSLKTFDQGVRDILDDYVNNTASKFAEGREAASGSLHALEDDLTNTFKSGKLTLKSFSDFLISEFARMQARAIIRPLIQGVQDGGGFGGLFGGIGKLFGFGGGSSSSSGLQGNFPDAGDFMSTMVAHSGRGPGETPALRRVPVSTFYQAPRYHSGLNRGERAAIITDEESVLTPGQMRAMGKSNVVVNVYEAPGTRATVQQSTGPGGQTQLAVVIEQIETALAGHIMQGQGLAVPMMRRFGLNPAKGAA